MTEQKMQRLSIVVAGRVQGVGYRFFVEDKAEHYSLTGWVRNCSNGSVELEAQGFADDLQHFCADLKEGPPAAVVTSLQVTDLPVIREEKEFGIRHSY